MISAVSATWRLFRDDRYLRAILIAGLVVQVVSAVHAIGYWHPDQQHSIIEFATYKLGITPPELMARELAEEVRQTLQVYVFLVFYQLMRWLHLDDAYTAHTILRVVVSLLNFTLFKYIVLRALGDRRRVTLYAVLLLANFSWAFPYVRTQFSSESLGGLTYFLAIVLYLELGRRAMPVWRAGLVGLVLSLAFFFRFEMGFAMVGFGLWLLFLERVPLKLLAFMGAGFLAGVAFNVFLDSLYYGHLVFTPYNYWDINITQGRATAKPDSVWSYVGVLSLLLPFPPLSFVLLFFLGRGLYQKLRDPYSLSVVFFLAAHAVVPHKEPRFLFPVLGILPVILGYGFGDYLDRLPEPIRRADFNLGLQAAFFVTLPLNAVLLVLALFIPVAQHIAFTKILNDYFDEDVLVTIVFYQRTPYETPTARNVATYYLHSKKPNLKMETVRDRTGFVKRLRRHAPGTYFVSTYDRLVRDRLLDEMDCKRLAVSSEFLLQVNAWVERLSDRVLPELWALYDCDGAGS